MNSNVTFLARCVGKITGRSVHAAAGPAGGGSPGSLCLTPVSQYSRLDSGQLFNLFAALCDALFVTPRETDSLIAGSLLLLFF